MKVTVCIGSSCHLKGSRRVVESLQYLIAENNLKDKVDLGGTFCMGNCQNGVCVTVDDKNFSASPTPLKNSLKQKYLQRYNIEVVHIVMRKSAKRREFGVNVNTL